MATTPLFKSMAAIGRAAPDELAAAAGVVPEVPEGLALDGAGEDAALKGEHLVRMI